MTLGSLFDGIGGWLLAARHAGITTVWASEIEPFPCSVTARHFPAVKQLGDITQIDPDEIATVDIICAASPCQDLSIAGKRKGLCGERSGLFRTAVHIVRRMRTSTGGRYPRYFVWENVPGAFSSNKGADFRAVLEEIGQTEIPIPQHGKWATAGPILSPLPCGISSARYAAAIWSKDRWSPYPEGSHSTAMKKMVRNGQVLRLSRVKWSSVKNLAGMAELPEAQVCLQTSMSMIRIFRFE